MGKRDDNGNCLPMRCFREREAAEAVEHTCPDSPAWGIGRRGGED